MPFKGSNVEGQWDVNNKNEWYYVITSYEWYPIFLFINNQWYRTLETYSNSTAKQMNHVNPVRYDSGLQEDVKVVTKYEMERIMDGSYNFDDVKTRRVTDFVRGKDNVIGTKKLISGGYGDTAHRVSFTITDIDEVDDKIKIFVKVNKAGKMDGRKMVADINYQNNPQLVSDIENTIKQDILRTHPKYLMDGNTEIEIIH